MKITKSYLRQLIREAINSDATFGMKKSDYDALISASKRKGYKPSKEKVAGLKKKYPKVKDADLVTALILANSPAKDTLTIHDVLSHLKKLNK